MATARQPISRAVASVMMRVRPARIQRVRCQLGAYSRTG